MFGTLKMSATAAQRDSSSPSLDTAVKAASQRVDAASSEAVTSLLPSKDNKRQREGTASSPQQLGTSNKRLALTTPSASGQGGTRSAATATSTDVIRSSSGKVIKQVDPATKGLPPDWTVEARQRITGKQVDLRYFPPNGGPSFSSLTKAKQYLAAQRPSSAATDVSQPPGATAAPPTNSSAAPPPSSSSKEAEPAPVPNEALAKPSTAPSASTSSAPSAPSAQNEASVPAGSPDGSVMAQLAVLRVPLTLNITVMELATLCDAYQERHVKLDLATREAIVEGLVNSALKSTIPIMLDTVTALSYLLELRSFAQRLIAAAQPGNGSTLPAPPAAAAAAPGAPDPGVPPVAAEASAPALPEAHRQGPSDVPGVPTRDPPAQGGDGGHLATADSARALPPPHKPVRPEDTHAPPQPAAIPAPLQKAMGATPAVPGGAPPSSKPQDTPPATNVVAGPLFHNLHMTGVPLNPARPSLNMAMASVLPGIAVPSHLFTHMSYVPPLAPATLKAELVMLGTQVCHSILRSQQLSQVVPSTALAAHKSR